MTRGNCVFTFRCICDRVQVQRQIQQYRHKGGQLVKDRAFAYQTIIPVTLRCQLPGNYQDELNL